MTDTKTTTQNFLEFVNERVVLGNNSGTFVDFLAASVEVSVEEAKAMLDPEVAAGRLEYGTLDGALFVRLPQEA